MRAYIDSSVVLRLVLGQADALAEWQTVTAGVASRLLEIECLRTLDRFRLANARLGDEELAARRAAVFRVLEGVQIVEVSPAILSRAARPMPTPLGTLDAIHLATAQSWRDAYAKELVVATHDRALALAAMADGFHVIGS